MKKLLSYALLLTLPFTGLAQKLVLEKTYEVDRKAKRGFLDLVTTDPKDKTTTLSFITNNGNNGKIKYQNYIFDKDYNFIKTEEGAEQLYKNKRYKGEKYSVEGITVEPGMLGKMVLRKKLVEYNWSWFNGRYTKKVTLLDKIKPKDDEGNSYMLVKKFEDDETGSVIALVIVAFGKGANPNEFILMKIDKDLKIEIMDRRTFTTPKYLTKSFVIPAEVDEADEDEDVSEEDISRSDMCFMFAGNPDKKNKEAATNFQMWRVSREGKIVNTVDIKVLKSAWNVESVIAKNGSLYFVGPANEETSSKAPDETKWKFYQLAKITKDKVDYITTTDMDEFEAKLKKPASQSKNPAYNGKRFRLVRANVTSDGSLFLCGQNFKEAEFKDVLMFYFDNAGKLKAQYGVRLEEVNTASKSRATNQFVQASNGSVFWTVWELCGWKEEVGDSKLKGLYYPSVAKINLATGDISDFTRFGTVKDKPKYYLQNNYPLITNPDDGSQVYLGVDKPGKVFWFGKVVMD
ncbi:MAG: hypothetical protein H0U95_06015 [Bacteroidetes bacterium]|nr:hypothetical protein [Bacteroidota bacterium]